MEKKVKERTLLSTYKRFVIVPIIIIAVIIAAAIGLIVSYALTSMRWFLIIFLIFAAIALGAYGFFFFVIIKRMRKVFYDQLFGVTITNIKRIDNNVTNMESYGESTIKEINQLEEAMKSIQTKLDSAYLVTKTPDFSKLSLEYVNPNRHVITYKSFKQNLNNIIFQSQSFRNTIIEVFYRLPKDTSLSQEDKKRVLDLYFDSFKEIRNSLFMFGEDGRSLIIYLPVIDSFSAIKERLELLVSDSSVMIRDSSGVKHIPAQYAIVAYPYSSEDMILGDLAYAKRQNKPYNLFLPNRVINEKHDNLLMNTTMNLNYMSQIINSLNELDYSSIDNTNNLKILHGVLNTLANLLNVTDAGVLALDEVEDKYYVYEKSDNSTLFVKDEVNRNFIKALEKAVDEDQTYYFSQRKNANYALEREIDLRGITSGDYYVIKSMNKDKASAIVYLFNRGGDLMLNSYLRETFLVVCLRIENYFEKKEIADYADIKDDQNENILALSNMFAYRINNDFTMLDTSKNFKKVFPHVKSLQPCYKELFGLDKPCKDCPLKTHKKRYAHIKNHEYEISTVLNDRKSNEKTIVLKAVTNEFESGDLFNNNLLVYSYKSLLDALKNEYLSNGRGYLVLLKVDNYEKFITNQGSGSYEFVMRNYVRNLKNKLGVDDIYFYNPTTLALHLPYAGHADVINKIESIFPLSKEHCLESRDDELMITYLASGYPHGYSNADDFMRNVSDFYHSQDYVRNQDFIYFSDASISRSANKRAFIVSVLESEFNGTNFGSMNMQPIVKVKDRHILGAEVLLRINDAHRNVFFNAAEISRIAAQENLTHLITESTINFVGTLFKEYGNNTFKTNKFSRIAINIDETYLLDPTLVKKVSELVSANKLPNEFVSAEIPEDLISKYQDKVKPLVRELAAHKMMLSCDRFTGNYVDPDSLKELGIKELKIARDIILKIDRDPLVFEELKKTIQHAKSLGMQIAAVGVENETQFKLLKELDEDMVVQGYYFYKPLTRSDLIAAIVSYQQ